MQRLPRILPQLGIGTLGLAVAACAGTPYAGLYPVQAPGPVQTLTEFRLNGTALLNEEPFTNASLRVFDLASGDPVVLTPTDASGAAVPTTPDTRFVTDSQAKFNYIISNVSPTGVYKVVA